jgi:hypothetical protein
MAVSPRATEQTGREDDPAAMGMLSITDLGALRLE